MDFHIYLDEDARNDTIRKAIQDLDEKSRQQYGGSSTDVERIWFHRDEYGLYIDSLDFLEELPPRYKPLARHVKQVRFFDEFPGGEIPLGVYEQESTKSKAVVEERLVRRNDVSEVLTRIRITGPSVEAVSELYRVVRRGDTVPTERWLGTRSVA